MNASNTSPRAALGSSEVRIPDGGVIGARLFEQRLLLGRCEMVVHCQLRVDRLAVPSPELNSRHVGKTIHRLIG